MVMDLKEEMASIYEAQDPWNYGKANRHMVTVGVCQQHWGGGTLVEYACGEGVLLRKLCTWLHPYPMYVTGLDIDPTALARAKADFHTRPRSSAFVQCDIREPNLPSAHADLILVSDVLPYVPSQAKEIVKRLWEQVAPHGCLVLTSWLNGHAYGPCFEGAYGLPGGEHVMRVGWVGPAVGADGVEHTAEADYLVVRKSGR